MDPSWIDNRVKLVQKKDHVGKVYGWVRGETDLRPVVLDGKKPYAIVNMDVFMSRQVRQESSVDKVALPVPVVHKDESLADIVHHFSGTLVPYLPVVDDRDKVLGVIDAVTLLRMHPERDMTIRHGYQQLEPLRLDHTLNHAMLRFREENVHHLPVVDERGCLQGILPQKVLCFAQDQIDQRMGNEDRKGVRVNLLGDAVEGHMINDSETVPLDGDWQEVLDQLADKRYAVIALHGRVRGIVTAPYALRMLELAQKEGMTQGIVKVPYQSGSNHGRAADESRR